MKNFSEIEKLLLSKHIVIKKNGIDFLYPILKKLDNPHKRLGRVIHITGTNGKGSVAYLMESVLRSAGYRTALFTSPHITGIRERIKLCGKDISEEDFIRIFNKVYKYANNLSFFEIITLIAFEYFAEQKVDFSIIEVGIGGKFDTTNVIEEKDLCFITSINYDHQNILGNTLEEIAFQKAGIIKKDSICISPFFDKNIRDVIENYAKKVGGKVIFIKDFHRIDKVFLKNNFMSVRNIISGEKYNIGIIGINQTLNLSMIKKGIDILRKKGFLISEKSFRKGIRNVNINARFQIIKVKNEDKDRFFIIDGAHNVEAIKSFINTLKLFKIKNISFVFSMLYGKDYISVLNLLSKYVRNMIFTKINYSKALEPYIMANEYQKISPLADITISQDIEEAIKIAMNKSKYICVCGSFYLASELLKILRKKNLILSDQKYMNRRGYECSNRN